jgi:hypothetical protein
MIKRLLVRGGMLVGTLGIVLAGAAAFSAFEAHIINVTARIDNALSVETGAIEYGPVFPEQYLTENIQVGLSDTFLSAQRDDDVEFVIKQKPKVKTPCGTDSATSTPCGQDPNDNPVPGDPYAIVTVGAPYNFTGPAWQFCEEHLPVNAPYGTYNSSDLYWRYCYIPLANYLSKHGANPLDVSVDAFHHAYTWASSTASQLDPLYIASGRLSKADQVTSDTCIIDLAVPCFVGECAQDWETFVHSKNPSADPNAFMLPKELKNKMFGTDLWIEVTNISLTDHQLSQCGIVASTTLATWETGLQTNPATLDFTIDNPFNPNAANSIDHDWIHIGATTPGDQAQVVWDMGTAQSSVWLVPGIDHGPVPQESEETTLAGSDSIAGPWEIGTMGAISAAGPSSWISDDNSNQWTFTKPYRYIRGTAGTAIQNDGDSEVDAVCANLE